MAAFLLSGIAMQKRVDFGRLPGTLGLGLVILLAAAPGPVFAQSPPPQGSARPKVQPPPLFPDIAAGSTETTRDLRWLMRRRSHRRSTPTIRACRMKAN